MSPFLIDQLIQFHEESRRYDLRSRRVRHVRARIFLSLKRRFRRRIPRDLAQTVAGMTDQIELERWSLAAETTDDLEAFRAEMTRPHQPRYLGRRCGP